MFPHGDRLWRRLGRRSLLLTEDILLERGADVDLARNLDFGVGEEAVVPPIRGAGGTPLPADAEASHPAVLGRAAAAAKRRHAMRASQRPVALLGALIETLPHGEENGLDGQAWGFREAVVFPQNLKGTDIGHV